LYIRVPEDTKYLRQLFPGIKGRYIFGILYISF
jgi:hypothetical protein